MSVHMAHTHAKGKNNPRSCALGVCRQSTLAQLFRGKVMPITRALSIQQPFAELIMVGKKKFEYRSIPTKIRERVYVYASKKSGPEKRWKESGYEPGSLPIGVLVGSVDRSSFASRKAFAPKAHLGRQCTTVTCRHSCSGNLRVWR